MNEFKINWINDLINKECTRIKKLFVVEKVNIMIWKINEKIKSWMNYWMND